MPREKEGRTGNSVQPNKPLVYLHQPAQTIKYNRKEEKIKKSMHPVSSSSIQVDLTNLWKLLNIKTYATGNLMQETLKIATRPDVVTNMNSSIL